MADVITFAFAAHRRALIARRLITWLIQSGCLHWRQKRKASFTVPDFHSSVLLMTWHNRHLQRSSITINIFIKNVKKKTGLF